MQKYITIFIALSLAVPAVSQPDSIHFCNNRIANYLDKEKALSDYYTIDKQGITMYASPEKKAQGELEYKIYWDETAEVVNLFNNLPLYEATQLLIRKKDNRFKEDKAMAQAVMARAVPEHKPDPKRPFAGLRIAIDPGHIAGDMETAKIEKKFIDMPADPAVPTRKKPIRLVEGQLNLETALLLKEKLEQGGAEVMLTRSKPNQTAFGGTLDEWITCCLRQAVDSMHIAKEIDDKQKTFLLTRAGKKEVFRTFFRDLELAERARKINAFGPDITVIIHYNVDEGNNGWKKQTNKNFVMTFAPGSFMKDELEKPQDRACFVKLLFSPGIESSMKLCSTMTACFERELKVPAAGEGDAAYLSTNCMNGRARGVYLRNLSLTRQVNGTLVYGETLYQDHVKESLRLTERSSTDGNVQLPVRVHEVADAYYKGLLEYLQNRSF